MAAILDFTNGSGAISFQIPDNMALLKFGGIESYWIRARIESGDFGQDAPTYEVTGPGIHAGMEAVTLFPFGKITFKEGVDPAQSEIKVIYQKCVPPVVSDLDISISHDGVGDTIETDIHL